MSDSVLDTQRSVVARAGITARMFVLATGVFLLGIFVAGLPYLFSADPVAQYVAADVLFGVTLIVGCLAYLYLTDRGTEFLDVQLPTLRTGVFILFSTGVVLIYDLAFEATVDALGLPLADNTAPILDEVGTTTVFLWAIATSILFIGPSEEILNRGIIQKRLYSAFPKPVAAIVASIPFTLLHFPVFYVAMPDPLGVTVALIWVFGASLIYGWVYLRTENIVAPALVHGFNNAYAFTVLYFTLTPHTI